MTWAFCQIFFPCNRSLVETFRLYNASVLLMAVTHQFPQPEKQARPHWIWDAPCIFS